MLIIRRCRREQSIVDVLREIRDKMPDVQPDFPATSVLADESSNVELTVAPLDVKPSEVTYGV